MEQLKNAPSRIEILNEIFSHFQFSTQWIPHNMDNSVEALNMAEALIQILEVKDCGSIGGFDEMSPTLLESGFMLYDRFLSLVRKYGNYDDIEECCGFTLDKMFLYFKGLSLLRDLAINEREPNLVKFV